MNENKRKAAVVVDAYSSGNLYPAELRKRGLDVLHVQSTPVIPSVFVPSFKPGEFVENLVHADSTAATLEKLSRYEVLCVIAGSEPGVVLSDELSERLRLPTNGTALSEARRDKFKMSETIRAKGLAAVRQFQSDDLDEIRAWVKRERLGRCVLKPLHSAGTDGVFFCDEDADVARAFGEIVGKTNKLGLFNEATLAQEFLRGTEYIVDTVSREGAHYVTDIWRYRKKETGRTTIYDVSELMPADGEVSDRLTSYSKRVLDALGIRNGCGHLEVMDTSGGAVLVEIGARPCGSATPIIVEKCTGRSQIDLSVDAYLDGAAFRRKTANPYARNKSALFVYLISEREGTLAKLPDFSPITRLKSYSRHHLVLRDDKRIYRTKDIFTTPGWVELVHEDRDLLYADYERVRDVEKTLFA